MRCPTCHYLGFEPEPRCKNCGYDFSFSEPESADESTSDAVTHGELEPDAFLEPALTDGAARPVMAAKTDRMPLATFWGT